MDDIEVEVIVSKNHNDKFDNFKSWIVTMAYGEVHVFFEEKSRP